MKNCPILEMHKKMREIETLVGRPFFDEFPHMTPAYVRATSPIGSPERFNFVLSATYIQLKKQRENRQ